MLNHIVIMGRLTQDPELRRTQSGLAVASFTLAVDRDFQSKDAQEKETDFINCVAWRSTAEFVCKHFSKGKPMAVSGRLQIRKYTDKDGNKRTAAEVVADNVYFADSKSQSQPSGGTDSAASGSYQNSAYQGSYQSRSTGTASFAGSDFSILEDDDNALPF